MTCKNLLITLLLFSIFLSPNVIANEFGDTVDYSKLSATQFKKDADIYFEQAFNGVTLTEQNQATTKALGKYYILTKIKPLDSYAYTQMGRLYDMKKDYLRAKQYFNIAFNININDPYTNFYFAELNYHQKKYNEALRYYLNARKNNYSDSVTLNSRLYELYDKLGDVQKKREYQTKVENLK